MDWFMDTGIRIVAIIAAAVLIFFICRWTFPAIMKRMVAHRMTGEAESEIKKRTATLSSVLVRIAGIVILVLAVITILPEFGVNITALIAGIGVGGLAIAFAAQNLVRDYISGFFVILEDQYRIGDVIAVAGVAGTVEDIGLRRTIIRDADANVHSVPNGKIELSTNMTRKFSRVNLNVSVGYNEDLNRVIGVINDLCREMAEDPNWKEDFLTTPTVVRVDKLGDSGIDIKIMGDTKPARQWALTGELRLRLKNTFDAQGIEIPWPHTKVYFGNSPTGISEN